MKTQWEFKVAARGCHFKRTHTYIVSVEGPVELGRMQLPSLMCQMKVTPLEDETPDDLDQFLRLMIELPLAPEGCGDFASYLAHCGVERLAFHARADLRLLSGMVMYTRIPETPEEEEEVGDRPYGVTIRLVEEVGTPSFEDLGGKLEAGVALHQGLVAQFNETARDASATRRFLGFFRILENFVHGMSGGGPLKRALKENEALRNYALTLHPTANFDEFVDEIVSARHECAHLKLDRGFGYVPTDPRIEEIVNPRLALLEELAHFCVAGGPYSGSGTRG